MWAMHDRPLGLGGAAHGWMQISQRCPVHKCSPNACSLARNSAAVVLHHPEAPLKPLALVLDPLGCRPDRPIVTTRGFCAQKLRNSNMRSWVSWMPQKSWSPNAFEIAPEEFVLQ